MLYIFKTEHKHFEGASKITEYNNMSLEDLGKIFGAFACWSD
jgi:hypothetical protein